MNEFFPACMEVRDGIQSWDTPDGIIWARVVECYEGLAGQDRIALRDGVGRVRHYNLEELQSMDENETDNSQYMNMEDEQAKDIPEEQSRGNTGRSGSESVEDSAGDTADDNDSGAGAGDDDVGDGSGPGQGASTGGGAS